GERPGDGRRERHQGARRSRAGVRRRHPRGARPAARRDRRRVRRPPRRDGVLDTWSTGAGRRDQRSRFGRKDVPAVLRDAGRAVAMSDSPQPTGEPCLRCRTELQSLGQTELRTGGSGGAWKLIFGELAELGEGTMKVELLACPRCRRLELKLPEQG